MLCNNSNRQNYKTSEDTSDKEKKKGERRCENKEVEVTFVIIFKWMRKT